MKNKKLRYMAIKDGKVTVEETDDFFKTMDDEFGGNCYAVAIELFSQNTDICAFIEESSLFSKPLTVGIYRKEKMVDVLHGTVFFAKYGKINIRSLSLKDIDIIYRNLWRYDAKSFSIYL